MSKDKRFEEKEKLDAEIARSLSVIKMKEAHKKIEEVEKLRKRAAIQSINDRLSLNIRISKQIVAVVQKVKKEYKGMFDLEMPVSSDIRKYLNHVMVTYESIRFDFQTSIDVKKEDFDRLFPKIEANFSTYNSIVATLICLNGQMLDMKAYCSRLL